MATKIFKQGTTGAPDGGNGQAYFFAGTVVDKVRRVYRAKAQGANANLGTEADTWKADIVAMGYLVTSGAPTDMVEEPVKATVDADAIIATS